MYYTIQFFYLKPTLACQTKANKKNNTGITGIISVSGLKIAKAPGNLLIKNVSTVMLGHPAKSCPNPPVQMMSNHQRVKRRRKSPMMTTHQY